MLWAVAPFLLALHPATAQAPPPLHALAEVKADRNGDFVPDRLGQLVRTGGRATTGPMGFEGGRQDFFIQSGETGLEVIADAALPPPAPGDSILVTGWLRQEDGMTMLSAETFRIVPAPPHLPEPMRIDAGRSLERFEGVLVRLEGAIVGQGAVDEGDYLLVNTESGSIVNIFFYRGRAARISVGSLQQGDAVQVVGILAQYDVDAPFADGYQLYPRTSADLRTAGLPLSFYRRGLVLGSSLLLLAVLWGALLYRQVRSKTKALRALQESKRTLQQYASELERAKERAEEMSQLKSSFLTNMTHEIRTPLTSILGFCEVLREECRGDGAEFVELINGSATRLYDTLSSVLYLAELESGTLQLAPEEIDLAAEARALVQALAPRAHEQGLWLRFESDEEVVPAVADRSAVGHVLTHILSNALKFTPEGGVTVRARRKGEHVELVVVDTGIGISEAFLPHVFDEFRQESSGLTRTHEGNGLGLTITRHLMELMNGEVRVASTKGRGTTCTIRFRGAVGEGPTLPSPGCDGHAAPGTADACKNDGASGRSRTPE